MKIQSIVLILSSFLFIHCSDDDDSSQPDIDVENLSFQKVSSFQNGSGDEGFAEISAFDPQTNKLFIVNPNDQEISVWNISDISNPSKGTAISLSGIPNSVAVLNGRLAVALENASNRQANGSIVLYNTDDQALINSFTAGALPDMVTFSPDGKYIVSANEGEPNDLYTEDPEGSITIINTENSSANTISFSTYNQLDLGEGFRVFGPNAAFAEDVEPEYVAISDNSQTAYVTLQENNGIAVVDLATQTITNVFGLGYKDHSLPQNSMDVSNDDGTVGNFETWPVLGMYQPDAIEYVTIGGAEYLITANEGDSRDYEGFSEEVRVSDLLLDPEKYPNAAELQLDENLGRLKTTTATGDIDGDGDIDQIYAYGGRSFTIWNTSGSVIYDSENTIGTKTFELAPDLFNNDEGEVDERSDDKGAEPEAVTTLQIANKTLLFVGLERTGGVMIYDISTPAAPEFLTWINDAADVAPEGLLVVTAEDSPSGKDLIIVTHEVSNTIAIYEININADM